MLFVKIKDSVHVIIFVISFCLEIRATNLSLVLYENLYFYGNEDGFNAIAESVSDVSLAHHSEISDQLLDILSRENVYYIKCNFAYFTTKKG